MRKKFDDIFSRLDTMQECVGQTDRQTERHRWTASTTLTRARRAVKMVKIWQQKPMISHASPHILSRTPSQPRKFLNHQSDSRTSTRVLYQSSDCSAHRSPIDLGAPRSEKYFSAHFPAPMSIATVQSKTAKRRRSRTTD